MMPPLPPIGAGLVGAAGAAPVPLPALPPTFLFPVVVAVRMVRRLIRCGALVPEMVLVPRMSFGSMRRTRVVKRV